MPHDLEDGQKIAKWFGPPYNVWYVGKIVQVNKRKTKQDNVSAEFHDKADGKTWGHFLASEDTYGANRTWVLLKPIPIDLEPEAGPP